MSHDSVATRLGLWLTSGVAKRPKAAMMLLLLLLLVAAQGTVGAEAADFSDFSTSGSGSVYDGP